MSMYQRPTEKVISKNILVGIFEVNDKKEQDLDPEPENKSTDPRIRFRIRTKMTRIRNTIKNSFRTFYLLGVNSTSLFKRKKIQ